MTTFIEFICIKCVSIRARKSTNPRVCVQCGELDDNKTHLFIDATDKQYENYKKQIEGNK